MQKQEGAERHMMMQHVCNICKHAHCPQGAAVRVAVHRLRRRYGELLREEIAQTVATPVEVDEELRYLIAVIRHGLDAGSNLPPKKM